MSITDMNGLDPEPWPALLEKVNRILPNTLPPEQELALLSEVLPYVRIRQMPRRDAYRILN